MKPGTRALLRAHIISSYLSEIVEILSVINRRFGLNGIDGLHLLAYFILIIAAPIDVPFFLVIMPVYEILVRHDIPSEAYYAGAVIYAMVFAVVWHRPKSQPEELGSPRE